MGGGASSGGTTGIVGKAHHGCTPHTGGSAKADAIEERPADYHEEENPHGSQVNGVAGLHEA